jgi:hypothetical protein
LRNEIERRLHAAWDPMVLSRSKFRALVLPRSWSPVLMIGLLVLMGACAPKAETERAARKDPKASDYVETPAVQIAQRTPDGQIAISGRAAANAIVRLSAPEGQSLGMTSGADGAFAFTAPVSAAPRMLALTSEREGRVVHSDGALILLPAPGLPLVVARPGYGAAPVASFKGKPAIISLDYDGGGGAMVAGIARPRALVRLFIDGQLEGEARADALGRFSAPAVKHPLAPGPHAVRVETSDGAVMVAARVSRVEPLLTLAYRAVREEGAWRLDWRAAPKGVQSTLLFDSAATLLEGGRP